MGYYIDSPTGNVRRGHNGAFYGSVTGSASGAAAGSSMGVYGAIIGGVVGGIAGAIKGSNLDSAKFYQRKAQAWEIALKERQAAAVRRDMIRKFRMQRAMQLVAITSEEGGINSSSTLAAVGSTISQEAVGQASFEAMITMQRKIMKNLRKAGKFQDAAANWDALMKASEAAASSSFGMNPSAGGKQTASSTIPMSNSNGTYGNAWGQTTDWNTFGSDLTKPFGSK